ncbi:integrase arm-type DNA-binding domain-containing protein [Mesorhizobium sp. BH1-1-5]|uniref:integrase arm-type DNA-binding domain-containing protein n=1 Tax=Mesorhizobium sp. BH1-1-5 TaxID=2876661 RepID=UPI001CCB35FA|nr:integrase arm-type DNA-binding domain-containing protein [Mesorhizobium sp. BH1-1-5]MBZ9989936.1 integrase arm-type DNA-binding domain-containing protein [Mesorhizobium sp. BH1-1-5]
MVDIRILINDRAVSDLKAPSSGQYRARDTQLKGFHVIVGRRSKTFAVQGDLRKDGKRVASISVRIGEGETMSTREARAIAKTYLAQISKGQHPDPKPALPTEQLGSASGPREGPPVQSDQQTDASPKGVTLGLAWERYRDAHLIRKGRSNGTIEGYRDHVERLFKQWRDTPLQDLAEDPAKVITRHDEITKDHGPYIANGSMRTLRAVYNHARRAHRYLPADNPASIVDWNSEKRRNTAMGLDDLSSWFHQVAVLQNPIRREFHLFSLLSGCRPTALMEAQPQHLDMRRRTLHIPQPKGGADRAFDIPLSRQMILCLVRTIRFAHHFYPSKAKNWLFTADSDSGHLAEQKEDRDVLSKWGNDLRQTFRTLATPAGVSEFDARLLMNHAIPGVNAGYISRHKLLEDHLRAQQQAISDKIFSALRNMATRDAKIRSWLGPRATLAAINAGRREDSSAPRNAA